MTATLVAAENIDVPDTVDRRNRISNRALRVADHRRTIIDREGLVQFGAERLLVSGSRHSKPRNHRGQCKIPHAVVGGTVVACDPGAIEHDGDGSPMKGDVHEQLVVGAVEEGCVQRDNGMIPRIGQACRRGERMLLRNADVDDTVGETVPHGAQSDGAEHRRRQGDNARVFLRRRENLIREH